MDFRGGDITRFFRVKNETEMCSTLFFHRSKHCLHWSPDFGLCLAVSGGPVPTIPPCCLKAKRLRRKGEPGLKKSAAA